MKWCEPCATSGQDGWWAFRHEEFVADLAVETRVVSDEDDLMPPALRAAVMVYGPRVALG